MLKSSSIPVDWYPEQYELAAKELDFDLHLAAQEAEITSGISVCFTPMPEPVSELEQQKNSLYNLNEILDSFK